MKEPSGPGRRRITAETGHSECDEPETGPLRRCIVTRERAPKERMLRFVIAPDGTLVPDLAARLPGRGMWLSARSDVLDSALAKRTFSRVARCEVRVPSDLPAMLRWGLMHRIAELLGLARRAGQAVAGFEKARAWLRSGRAGLILQACDGSAEERERLLSGVTGIPVYAPLDSAALGRVFSRERAVHVVAMPGRLASTIAGECERLLGLTGLAAALDERSDGFRQAGQ